MRWGEEIGFVGEGDALGEIDIDSGEVGVEFYGEVVVFLDGFEELWVFGVGFEGGYELIAGLEVGKESVVIQ